MIVPPVADHVTAVLVAPVTVAVNCCVPPVWIDVLVGEMETETAVGTTAALTAMLTVLVDVRAVSDAAN